MLSAFWPEPIREPLKVRLINCIEYFHHSALDVFCFDRCDA